MQGSTQSQGHRYELLRLLATGGMGEVFLARQQGAAGFTRRVVVKRILRHLARDATFLELFVNEARVAALLNHPNVVQVFELGRDADTYFLAMEYVDGGTLGQLQSRLRAAGELLPVEVAVHIALQCLDGLRHAHELRDEAGAPLALIHRDVSPDNVLLSLDGQVKIADFGIARASGHNGLKTSTLRGKYGYMSPEQMEGEALRPTSDLYSVGVILFELLAGRPPFVAPTDAKLIDLVLRTTPPSLSELRSGLPEQLEQVALRALSKRPEDRFASAESMAAALSEAVPSAGAMSTRQALSQLLRASVPASDGVEDSGPGTRPLHTIETIGEVAAPAGRSQSSGSSWRGRRMGVVLGAAVAMVLVAAAVRTISGSGPAETAELPGDARVEPSPPQIAAGSTEVRAAESSEPEADVGRPGHEESEPTARVDARDDGDAQRVKSSRSRVRSSSTSTSRGARTDRSRDGRATLSAKDSKPVEAARAADSSPGRIRFRVIPWAEVFSKGTSLGVTPLAPVSVPAGTHEFTLRNSELGVSRKVRVVVQSGREVLSTVNLFELAGAQSESDVAR